MVFTINHHNMFGILNIENDSNNESDHYDSKSVNDLSNNIKSYVENTKVSTNTTFENSTVIQFIKNLNQDFRIDYSKPIDINKPIKNKVFNNKMTKFIVGSSYIDELRKKYSKTKSNIRRNTRPCINVIRKSPDMEYGVCYKENCKFAHSIDELKYTMCRFDRTCRFRNGKPIQDGYIDSDNKCKFRHFDETKSEWIDRIGCTLPNLPIKSDTKKTINHIITPKKPNIILTPWAPLKRSIENRNKMFKTKLITKELNFNDINVLENPDMRIISEPTDELDKNTIQRMLDYGIASKLKIIE